MADAVRIGILGDFNPEFRSHHATTDSIQHAARKLRLKVESEWLPTPSLTAPKADKILESFDALWAAARSGLYFTPVNSHLTADEAGYIVDGTFLRLREASLTYTAPDVWANMGLAKTNSASAIRNSFVFIVW